MFFSDQLQTAMGTHSNLTFEPIKDDQNMHRVLSCKDDSSFLGHSVKHMSTEVDTPGFSA